MPERLSGWTFLTNHAFVLLCLTVDPAIRIADIAERIGVSERAVQRILRELEDSGYLSRRRQGRRNLYQVHLRGPLRRPALRHRSVSDLLTVLERDAAAHRAP